MHRHIHLLCQTLYVVSLHLFRPVWRGTEGLSLSWVHGRHWPIAATPDSEVLVVLQFVISLPVYQAYRPRFKVLQPCTHPSLYFLGNCVRGPPFMDMLQTRNLQMPHETFAGRRPLSTFLAFLLKKMVTKTLILSVCRKFYLLLDYVVGKSVM